MTGILLAAGRGTRLAPITDSTPKCLLPVGGKPMLERWLNWWSTCDDLDTVVINLHHLAEQVLQFVTDVAERYPFRLITCLEPELLGTGASVRHYASQYAHGAVLVGYADTLIEHDLDDFVRLHRSRQPDFGSILLFRSPAPSQGGVVSMDAGGYVRSIHEKPSRPTGNLAFAGLAVLERACLDIDARGSDLVQDYLSEACRTPMGLCGVECAGRVLDIGTPERLADTERWTSW